MRHVFSVVRLHSYVIDALKADVRVNLSGIFITIITNPRVSSDADAPSYIEYRGARL
jgi:hypothetical protein